MKIYIWQEETLKNLIFMPEGVDPNETRVVFMQYQEGSLIRYRGKWNLISTYHQTIEI
jgi:hypothetical protein